VTVLAAVVALTLSLFAQLGEHPVPLEKNFDAAKCVDCHAEKQQGKHVHTAISMGCTTCHSVASTGEKTEITLTAPPEQLCATCHEQKKEGTLHGPYAQNQCLTCHDPHASEFPAQTRAASNTLCLGCHADRPVRGKTSSSLRHGK
jgi:predicted CXXCH cytochrome family protein